MSLGVDFEDLKVHSRPTPFSLCLQIVDKTQALSCYFSTMCVAAKLSTTESGTLLLKL